MTQNQKRIRIAEACGWRNIINSAQDEWHFLPSVDLYAMNGASVAGRHVEIFPDGTHHPLPDYFRSLDAMHEAEKACIYDRGGEYEVPSDYWMELCLAMPLGMAGHAPAEVRAEAFGRALNLW